MSQLWGFLGKALESLIKTGLPLKGHVLKTLAKSALVPLELMVVASATNAAIQKKVFGFGTKILIFSNENLNDIMKIIKSLGNPVLLIKGVTKIVEN